MDKATRLLLFVAFSISINAVSLSAEEDSAGWLKTVAEAWKGKQDRTPRFVVEWVEQMTSNPPEGLDVRMRPYPRWRR